MASGGAIGGGLQGNSPLTAADIRNMKEIMEQRDIYTPNQQDYRLMGQASWGSLQQAHAPTPLARMETAQRQFDDARYQFVKDRIKSTMPEGFESLATKVAEMFWKVAEWREDGKYVCELTFRLPGDDHLYYKVKRKIPVAEGQAYPSITDVQHCLSLNADEAALLATT